MSAEGVRVATRVSFITAVHPHRTDHLLDTAASIHSVRRLLLANGVEADWVLAVDGPSADPATVSQARADHVLQLSARHGVSAARNIALAASTGDWVFPLDADDVLDIAGFASLFDAEIPHDIAWVASNRRWLDDSSRTPRWIVEDRTWRRHELEEQWTSPFPFHPNNVLVRRSVALAVFGWPALEANEDLAFCLNVSACGQGAGVRHVTVLYRRWPGQTIRGEGYRDAKVRSFSAIEAAVNARRSLNGMAAIRAPRPSTD